MNVFINIDTFYFLPALFCSMVSLLFCMALYTPGAVVVFIARLLWKYPLLLLYNRLCFWTCMGGKEVNMC